MYPTDLAKFRRIKLGVSASHLSRLLGIHNDSILRAEFSPNSRLDVYRHAYIGIYSSCYPFEYYEELSKFRDEVLDIDRNYLASVLKVNPGTLQSLESGGSPSKLGLYSVAYQGVLSLALADHYDILTAPKDLDSRELVLAECELCKKIKGCEDHHIIPKSCGGWDGADNSALLCVLCHRWLQELA